MKQQKMWSLLLFLLILVLCVAVACDNGARVDDETTDGTAAAQTTAGITESATEPVTEAETEYNPAIALGLPADAAAVDALIATIDGATIENEEAMDRAYLAYWYLTEEERSKVVGYEALQTLRYELTKAYVVKEYMDTRMRHNELLLGAYVCNNTNAVITTDAHIRDMRDCYIDFAWQVCRGNGVTHPAPVLDLYKKYGIGVFEWTGHLGLYVTHEATADDMRAMAAGNQYDHEALWGIFQVDEPTTEQIAGYWNTGKVIAEEILPECAYNMTIYAYQGVMLPQYEKLYINHVGGTVANDFICYDHYVYDNKSQTVFADMLDNLNVPSRYCREHNRDLYVILQGFNTGGGTMAIERLQFQAYSAMAYGAKSITWACWIRGWGENNVLDEEGNKTPLYDNLKEVNRELMSLEPIYMRYTAKGNALLYDPKTIIAMKMKPYHGNTDVGGLNQTSLTDITVNKNDAVLIGSFEKNVGDGEAFMLVGCNNYLFPENKEVKATVTFRTADPTALVTAYVKGIPQVLIPDADGVYTVVIERADAVFVTVDKGYPVKTPEPSPEEENGLLFLLNEEGTAYTVVGMTEDNTSLELVIPASFKGLPVTAIGADAFNSKAITSVTIPESVTDIGDRSFGNCVALTAVTIPAAVTRIGSHAFVCCTDLLSVTFSGEKLTVVEDWAFAACAKLASITLPDSVISIGNGIFAGCHALSDVTLGSALTEIGDYAFVDCRNMERITLPDTLSAIGYRVFYGASSLSTVTIPASVTTVGENVFLNCASLTDIYCVAAERPEGWLVDWIAQSHLWEHTVTVHWGHVGG